MNMASIKLPFLIIFCYLLVLIDIFIIGTNASILLIGAGVYDALFFIHLAVIALFFICVYLLFNSSLKKQYAYLNLVILSMLIFRIDIFLLLVALNWKIYGYQG